MAAVLSKDMIFAFLRRHQLGVVATASRDGEPEAALVNFAVTPELEIIFETTTATRKYPNLKYNPRAEMVVGWDHDQTLQCRGGVDEPEGRAGERIKAAFLTAFPKKVSHGVWPGNSYFRLTPEWVRFSDYNMPRNISELNLPVTPRKENAPLWRLWESVRRGS